MSHSTGPAASVSGFIPWLGCLITIKSLILLQNTAFGAGLPQGCRNNFQNHALLYCYCAVFAGAPEHQGGDIRTNILVFQVPHQRAVLIHQVLSPLVMAWHLEGNTYRATKSGPDSWGRFIICWVGDTSHARGKAKVVTVIFLARLVAVYLPRRGHTVQRLSP